MTTIQPTELEIEMHKALGDAHACALLQGYPFTGFASVQDGKILLPPDLAIHQNCIPWPEMYDLRVFRSDRSDSNPIEWHAWRTADGTWGHRKATLSDCPEKDRLPRDFVLWGSIADSSSFSADGGWLTCRDEDRGIAIHVPKTAIEGTVKGDLALRVVHFLKPAEVPDDSDLTPLVEVWDAMITGLYSVERKEQRP